MKNFIFKMENHILGPFEKINLCFPFLFILLSTYFVTTGHRQTIDETIVWDLVATFIFFNGSHVFLTIMILCFIPEARRLVKKSWFQKKPLVLLSIFIFAYLFCISLLKIYTQQSKVTLLIVFFIPFVFFYRHALMQNFGMLMLYNSKYSGTSLAPTFKQIKIERFLFKLLTALYILNLFDKLIYKESLLINKNIWAVFIFITTLAVIFYVFTKSLVRNKKIYVLRLILYPLGLISPIAVAGVAAMHGFEYFLLTNHMINNSSFKSKLKLYVLFGFFLVLYSLFLILFSSRVNNISRLSNITPPITSDGFKKLMLTFFFAIEYFHYYLDSLIFKFKSPLVQEEIYPLLRGPIQNT